ncbi:uncharacterized protein BKA78DRAFT_298466 [Phyllosticta capitalensis]|uniref:uncharacterized protein n=1 Tax=Phyllosticta capitalensis TaxID=121624 RepID=UPI00312E7B86
MTAQQIQFQTAVFPGLDSAEPADNVTLVQSRFGFYLADTNVRTLSTNGISPGENIIGPLYVPDLQTDLCKNATAPYIPANVTRYANLPPAKKYHQIAIAPWSSAQCVHEFLSNAAADPLLRAFIFFPTDNSVGIPPPANALLWDLNDGGQWKADRDFGIYAVSGSTGRLVMPELAAYSGNLTSVPNGRNLSSLYHPSDYVRQIAQIPTNGGSSLPSLWVFLLIVLGLMILAICGSSLGVHWHQKRLRNQLRDRVIRGEIDLEALGIRRLTVPQEVLDRMLLYTYDANSATPPVGDSAVNTGNEVGAGPPVVAPTSERSVSYSQPTCAICLDDFVHKETTVRELPCHHIYHPECIDNFLRDNSSLCPLCKKTVLPRGYCPAVITNAMVRRERWLRRIRSRAAARGVSEDQMVEEESRRIEENRRGGLMRAAAFMVMGNAARRTRSNAPPDVEMQTANRPTAVPSTECPDDAGEHATTTTGGNPAPAPVTSNVTDISGANPAATRAASRPAAGTASRREWARQRALSMLGRDHHPDASTVAGGDESRGGRWRKMLGRVWPNLG